MSDEAMNDDDLDIPEITDFRGGARGKYYDLYWRSQGFVRLDPDVAQAFPDAEAVNSTLRRVARARQRRRAGVPTPQP